MTGAIASGIISVIAKKYQKKLKKVTKLIAIVTPALVVFERVISGALKDGIIDEEMSRRAERASNLTFSNVHI